MKNTNLISKSQISLFFNYITITDEQLTHHAYKMMRKGLKNLTICSIIPKPQK